MAFLESLGFTVALYKVKGFPFWAMSRFPNAKGKLKQTTGLHGIDHIEGVDISSKIGAGKFGEVMTQRGC